MKMKMTMQAVGVLLLSLALAGPALGQTTTTTGTTTTTTPRTTSTAARDRGRIEITEEMRSARRLVEPMLERLIAGRDVSPVVRAWAMAVQTKLKDIDAEDFIMLPNLLRQLDDRNETVRMTAIQILRTRVLELDKDEWIGIMSPLILEKAKTGKYPETRISAGKLLAVLGKLEEDDLTALPLLLDLTEAEDPESRRNAVEMIEQQIADALDERYLRRALTSQAVSTVRTSTHPEVRKAVGEMLVVLSHIDENAMASLFLLFDLARDDNEEVRSIFVQTVQGVVREARGADREYRVGRDPSPPAASAPSAGHGFEHF